MEGHSVRRSHQARRGTGEHRQDRLAHVQAHVLNSGLQYGNRFGRAKGTIAARGHQDDDEHLHTSLRFGQAESYPKAHQEAAGGISGTKWYSLGPVVLVKSLKRWYARIRTPDPLLRRSGAHIV